MSRIHPFFFCSLRFVLLSSTRLSTCTQQFFFSQTPASLLLSLHLLCEQGGCCGSHPISIADIAKRRYSAVNVVREYKCGNRRPIKPLSSISELASDHHAAAVDARTRTAAMEWPLKSDDEQSSAAADVPVNSSSILASARSKLGK